MPPALQGIFTPNIVPYDAKGRINVNEMEDIRTRIACVLAECGFGEAAHACANTKQELSPDPDLRNEVESIVRKVMQSLEH